MLRISCRRLLFVYSLLFLSIAIRSTIGVQYSLHCIKNQEMIAKINVRMDIRRQFFSEWYRAGKNPCQFKASE